MKQKNVVGLLALFLGGFGVHHFYLGNVWRGFFYLLFCWTFVPAVIAFFEAIQFFFMGDQKFQEKYNAVTMIMTASGPVRATPDTHVKCPDCRELVIKDARKCKHCGTALVPQ